ncbi:MAG: hypothetical protein J6A63_09960 [Clostridia bacterium]|nr:hypothetical protein [Clostridia bacterium]
MRTNKFFKVMAMVLACSSLASFAACRGGNESSSTGGDGDSSGSSLPKSELYVGAYDGGFGINWAETWAQKFETLHKNTEFEPGKKGVDVVVSRNPKFCLDGISMTLNDEIDEVCFIEQANYYNFINNSMVLDVSEWMTTPLEEYGETKSIHDKMSPMDQSYYGGNTTTPTYYGAPWYFCMPSINYDAKLFEDNGYYFKADGSFVADSSVENGVYTGEGKLSAGPDGEEGTFDDGLPATYDQFFEMCDEMVEDGVVPFIWGGSVQNNVNFLLSSLAADFEGVEQMKLNYTFDGTATTLVKAIENGIAKYEEATPITVQNGYEMKRQAGWYYGLKFIHRLITTEKEDGSPKYYNYDDCFSTSVSHRAAMQKFLRSNYTASMDSIAMLVDGSWFYNESSDVFDQMSSIAGANKKDRKIGVMPMPKALSEKVGTDTTVMQSWISSVFVRSGIDESKLDLARAFFRFIHTDECLSTYIEDCHNIRPFTHELTGVKESDLSMYGKAQYDLYKNAGVVNCYANNSVCKQFLSVIHGNVNSIVSINGRNESFNLITTAFNQGVSAEDYFKGMAKYMTADAWAPYTAGADV